MSRATENSGGLVQKDNPEARLPVDDSIRERMKDFAARHKAMEQQGNYLWNQVIEPASVPGGVRIRVLNRELILCASYSYLGLLNHPRITQAAKAAIDLYGTGTHGVRLLAGTLPIHKTLEGTIAQFHGTEDAITFSSGYMTNTTVITALVGRHDYIFSDQLNHASIVDGCLLSGAKLTRFRHRDLADLESSLARAGSNGSKLVITDAVFSMDGDIADLPHLVDICRRHGAWLMVDEAHSVGHIGQTGRGIEEHFNMPGVIDLKMGALSKAIPSSGGYIAGSEDLMRVLRHTARAFIFSAALTPAQAASADAAFKVMMEEPEHLERLRKNAGLFRSSIAAMGFKTLSSETSIVPIMCGSDEKTFEMARICYENGAFVLPIVAPAVPAGQARLRCTVTAAHSLEDIEQALTAFEIAGKKSGVLE